jgi:hypothetical protein
LPLVLLVGVITLFGAMMRCRGLQMQLPGYTRLQTQLRGKLHCTRSCKDITTQAIVAPPCTWNNTHAFAFRSVRTSTFVHLLVKQSKNAVKCLSKCTSIWHDITQAAPYETNCVCEARTGIKQETRKLQYGKFIHLCVHRSDHAQAHLATVRRMHLPQAAQGTSV